MSLTIWLLILYSCQTLLCAIFSQRNDDYSEIVSCKFLKHSINSPWSEYIIPVQMSFLYSFPSILITHTLLVNSHSFPSPLASPQSPWNTPLHSCLAPGHPTCLPCSTSPLLPSFLEIMFPFFPQIKLWCSPLLNRISFSTQCISKFPSLPISPQLP